MKPTLQYLLCLFGLVAFLAQGAEAPVAPPPIYKTIDISMEKSTIKLLHDSKGAKQLQVIKVITDKPDIYPPAVFYFLSSVLFDKGQKDDAMFWFYAAQLRARIDADICADKSAKPAVDFLNHKFGPPINQYAFKDIARLKSTVEKVVLWEQKTPCNYDRRWINLHGVQTLKGSTDSPLSAPKDQWEKIRKSSRDEYLSSFYASLPPSKAKTGK